MDALIPAADSAPPTSRFTAPGDPLARLAERKAARLRFLHALYQAADGSPDNLVSFEAFAAELGLDIGKAWVIRSYLAHEGLVRGATTSAFRITHQGVKEVEAALVAPSVPTEHFPPAENVILIGTAEGVVIQQGNQDSVQQVELGGARLDEARRQAAELEARLSALAGEDAELRQLIAEASTASAQLRSARPRLAAVKETVGTVRDLLESAVASGKAVAGILSALGAARALLALLG